MPSITQSGRLNKRLQFQSLGGTPNAGGELTTWVTYCTLWGSIAALKSQMIFNTDTFIAQSTYTVSIRFNSAQTINVADRIVCDGNTFVIQAILDRDMQHREIQILAYVLNAAQAGG